jgi:hypothetical protein
MRFPTTVAVASLLLLPGCASGPEPAANAGWGGIVEERIEPPAPLTGQLAVPTPSVRPYPVREFSPEELAFLDRAWTAFKRRDPAWDAELRSRWIEMGPEAAGVLAENLYRAMVASRVGGALHLVEITKKELGYLGGLAVPVVVGGLSVRATRNAGGEEVRVGQEILHDAAEVASLIGEPCVPGLLDIAGCGEPGLVREAVWALGNVADPRAEASLLALSSDPNLYVRAEAVLALRRYGSAPAGARLAAALEDEDSFVVERAAKALAAGKRTEVLPAVVDVLERAVRDGRIQVARACVDVLSGLTGEKIGPDAPAWRRALGGK